MAEESVALSAVPAGRALKVVRGLGRAVKKPETRVQVANPEKPMAGPGFWILVAVTSFDELVLDLIANISVVFAIFVFLTGFLVAAITIGYLYFSGVPMDMRKVTTMSVSLLIEILPFVSIIPSAVIALFVIRWFAQKDYREKLEKYRKQASPVPRVAPSPV
jgi:hypothetical protein